MSKLFLYLIWLIIFCDYNNIKSDNSTDFLRPDKIKVQINKAFAAISRLNESKWLYNGKSKYLIGQVNEQKLLSYIVKNSATQNEFYLLEIGAGNFQWGRNMARYINENNKISSNKKFHIISLRGENNLANERTEIGKCILYELGSFKIESLETEFRKFKLNIKGKIDLIISSWCFRHLVDPVGTFKQAYDLLRPQIGFFLTDGFFYAYKDDEKYDILHSCNRRLHTLFVNANIKCLRFPYQKNGSCDHFIIQHSHISPITFPIKYTGKLLKLNKKKYQIESKYITVFKPVYNPKNKQISYNQKDKDKKSEKIATCLGDESLYSLLSANEVFVKPLYQTGSPFPMFYKVTNIELLA